MKTKIYVDKMKALVCWLVVMLLFSACAKDDIDTPPVMPEGDDGIYAQVTLNTRAVMPSLGDDFESGIATLRLLIIDEENKLELNNLYTPNNAGRIDNPVVKLTEGKKSIYAVANEDAVNPSLNSLSAMVLGSTVDKKALEKTVFTNISPTVGTGISQKGMGILMTGLIHNVPIDSGYSILNPKRVEVEVERTLAKVTVNVQRALAYKTKPKEKLTIDKITFFNYRDKEYLFLGDAYPQNSTLVKKGVGLLTVPFLVDSMYIQAEDLTPNYTKVFDLYTPSNCTPSGSTALPSCIEIVYTKGSRPAKTDTINIATSLQGVDLLRNKHYTLNLTISPTQDNLEVDISVLPWKKVELEEEPGLEIFTTRAYFDDKPIAKDDMVSSDGGRLKLELDTKKTGWYAVLSGGENGSDMKIIQWHNQETPTPDKQTIYFDIGMLANLAGMNYIVSVFHPIYAQEPLNPICKVGFKQRGGFLSSAILKADQWPVELLPGKGLEIAKIGNVLPSEKSASQEKVLLWATEFEDVKGTLTGYGSGKKNTKILQDMGEKYPAANACRELGPDWFLPSPTELYLFRKHEESLGNEFKYFINNSTPIWASTQGSTADNAYARNIDSLGSTFKKNQLFVVRCIREVN